MLKLFHLFCGNNKPQTENISNQNERSPLNTLQISIPYKDFMLLHEVEKQSAEISNYIFGNSTDCKNPLVEDLITQYIEPQGNVAARKKSKIRI